MANAKGESQEPALRPAFDRRIKLEFHGARISSDGGLPHAFNSRILAIESAPNGECRSRFILILYGDWMAWRIARQ